jgi:hypothetical protein
MLPLDMQIVLKAIDAFMRALLFLYLFGFLVIACRQVFDNRVGAHGSLVQGCATASSSRA